MLSFSTVLAAVLPIYLLGGIGFALRRRKFLNEEMDRGLFRLVLHGFYPCLIIDKLLGNSLVQNKAIVAWGIGLGLGLILIGFAVAFVTGLCLRMQKGDGRRTFALTSAIQNYGYVAIPLLVVLFENDETLGVLFLHSLGVEIAIWTVGLMLLTGSFRPKLQNFLNGPIVAVVLGLFLVGTGLDDDLFLNTSGGGNVGEVLGSSMRSVISWLGVCAVPVALLLIGATVSDLCRGLKVSGTFAFGAILVRIVLLPAVILCAAKYLPIALELRQVLVVQAAMPAAVTPIIIARHYGGNPGAAVQVVLVTSLVGIVTIPLIVSVGFAWLGW